MMEVGLVSINCCMKMDHTIPMNRIPLFVMV